MPAPHDLQWHNPAVFDDWQDCDDHSRLAQVAANTFSKLDAVDEWNDPAASVTLVFKYSNPDRCRTGEVHFRVKPCR